MSFTAQVKREISRQTASARHCRIAELAALLSFNGTIQISEDDQIRILFQTEQEVVCGVFLELLRKLFHFSEEQISYEQQLRSKTSVYRVSVEDPADVVQILKTLEVLDEEGNFREEIPAEELPCLRRACCKKAFLKGAFLAAGAVSDPSRSYHLEFICESRGGAEQLAGILAEAGITASVSGRGKRFLAYIKEGSQISDLLGMMDARVAMLDFENARIVREVRGNINRKVNCETANIRKTADAAAGQIEEIRFIESMAGLGSLPPILDEIARIRLQYPTATLQELGGMLNPPVGKSGVNHRLRKLSAIAARLRAEQGGEKGSC